MIVIFVEVLVDGSVQTIVLHDIFLCGFVEYVSKIFKRVCLFTMPGVWMAIIAEFATGFG